MTSLPGGETASHVPVWRLVSASDATLGGGHSCLLRTDPGVDQVRRVNAA